MEPADGRDVNLAQRAALKRGRERTARGRARKSILARRGRVPLWPEAGDDSKHPCGLQERKTAFRAGLKNFAAYACEEYSSCRCDDIGLNAHNDAAEIASWKQSGGWGRCWRRRQSRAESELSVY